MAIIEITPLSIFIMCIATIFLQTTTTTDAASCHETDKAALLDFKNKITEDPLSLLGTWNQSTDCCTDWDGVKCDSNGRVTYVSRPGFFTDDQENEYDTEMHGTISPSLGNLEFLQLLDLSSLKFLTGSIPSELGKLSHLTSLSLNSNQLNGTIPASFQNLHRLNHLELGGNYLSGSVPTTVIQDMSSLTYLSLSENQLSGEIPYSVVKLVSLWMLDLGGNNFTGSIPSEIGSLKYLIYLHLSDNQLSGIIPSSIGELSNLQELDLSRNRLSGSIPSSLLKLPSLTSCQLSDNKLTGSISSSSIGGTGLESLNLDNNMLTGEIPDSIGNLTNLTQLSLKNNRFTGKIPSELAQIKSLEILDLSFNPLNLVNIPTWFSEMIHLRELYLAGTGLVGELPEWLTTMDLAYLDLSSNALAGEFPRWIGNMRELFFLNLSNNGFHSAIPIEFKTISYLDLHSNNFTGGLDYIFAKTSDGGQGYRLLDLSDNMFAGPIDEDIGNLSAIQAVESLILSNNPLGGSIPKSLGKMYRLTTLKLENNGLTGTIPAELSNSTWLESIVLSNNNLTGGIPSGLMNLRLFKELDVSHNMLTGEIPPHNATIPAASFEGNAGLCGSPLPPCKAA
ncbi:hypothetical protein MKW92_018102 [Papaver armeniacum]|nr:hypothetical protein MKW92_018102 [Papaver armeniacum]